MLCDCFCSIIEVFKPKEKKNEMLMVCLDYLSDKPLQWSVSLRYYRLMTSSTWLETIIFDEKYVNFSENGGTPSNDADIKHFSCVEMN